MTGQEEAERFVKKAPPLNQKELDGINALFPAYIFRRSKTREVWTSCCHRHETLPPRSRQSRAEREMMSEPHQREPKNTRYPPASPRIQCPYCGKPVIVKELGRSGHRENLTRYRRAAVLRWYRGALWARAYECAKHYSDGYSLTGQPIYRLAGVYRFRPGLAEASARYYYSYSFDSIKRQDKPLTKGRWNFCGPFHANADYGVGYSVIGVDEVQKSPFRYCMAAEAAKKTDRFLHFLTACCFYPRQIEMLMKAGMPDVVKDLAERGVKHAAAINWNEENPVKAFGLSRQDLKTFLGTGRDIRILELFKRLKGRVPLAECADWLANSADVQKTFQAAKLWNLPPEKLMRYLRAQSTVKKGMRVCLKSWEDYLTAAQVLGYPLHRENVLLPRNLGGAHDSATEEHRNRLEQERKEANQEQERLATLAYNVRLAELEKKYGFAMDGYVIQVPAGKEDILDEGRKLEHCVGGYADRHMEGKVTILFMRKEKQPDKSWLTIEMNGNRLVQIHGYRNEGMYSARGRIADDPRIVYREFLDTWLDWLKKGSRRDKDGNPKLPRKKKEGEAA